MPHARARCSGGRRSSRSRTASNAPSRGTGNFSRRRNSRRRQSDMEAAALRAEILRLVQEYYRTAHTQPAFVPGRSRVPYAGRVYDDREMTLLAESALDFWLTSGPYADRFELRMRQFFDSRDFILVNSGSSANLVMLSTICAPGLSQHRELDLAPLKPGDE